MRLDDDEDDHEDEMSLRASHFTCIRVFYADIAVRMLRYSHGIWRLKSGLSENKQTNTFLVLVLLSELLSSNNTSELAASSNLQILPLGVESKNM